MCVCVLIELRVIAAGQIRQMEARNRDGCVVNSCVRGRAPPRRRRHRLLTNSVTASVLYGSGDFLAQMIEKRQHVQSTGAGSLLQKR